MINGLLGLVGIDPVDWRNGNWTAQIAISVIVIWRWTGYNALIYLAGMQSISQDLYEAAALDGANRWQQFLHVTLPGLRPTILFTIVVSTIGASQLFGEPLLFGGGAGQRRPGEPVPDPRAVHVPAGLAVRAARPGGHGGLGDVRADHRAGAAEHLAGPAPAGGVP